jgi:hypothetical protein
MFIDVVQFAENNFLCWLKSFSSKKSDLIMDCFGNIPLTVPVSRMRLFEKVIASIPKIEKTIRHEIIKTCNSGS